MVDWAAMRNEYITGRITYRQLSAKYNVPLRTIADHAKADGWVMLKKQVSDKSTTMAAEAITKAKADISTRVYDAAGMMLDKVIEVSKTAKTAKDIRALTAAIKDIRDIAGVKSESDQEEQRARIEALRAKYGAGNEDDDDTGVIMLPPRLGEDDEE